MQASVATVLHVRFSRKHSSEFVVKRIGSLYYQLCRTIVLLQFKKSGIRILALEIQDIIDVCPTEAVDTLCIITNNTHLLALFRQLIDDGLLGKVGILILIYKHKVKLIHIFLTDILMLLE